MINGVMLHIIDGSFKRSFIGLYLCMYVTKPLEFKKKKTFI